MTDNTPARKLLIKKYTNRRFYDTTRSCHVTLTELHDLIVGGAELVITDSTSGEDITNQVLTQIILERDADKLGIFPSSVLHQMIRTQQQMLGSVVEDFFRQTLAAQRASQERWMQFLQNTIGAVPASPAGSMMDWTRQWMQAFTPGVAWPTAPRSSQDTAAPEWPAPATAPPASAAPPIAGASSAPPEPSEQRRDAQGEIDELRKTIAALAAKIERLSEKQD